MNIEEIIVKAVKQATVNWLKKEGIALVSLPPVFLELPKVEAHGDFSANVALQVASRVKKKPRSVAAGIVAGIELPVDLCQKLEVAGPGFINFHLTIAAVHKQLLEILRQGFVYGQNKQGADKRILLEFVSANPTGPLTIAHARQAAVGDALARIFFANGYQVEKEYYLNDRGRQMKMLAASTRARYLELLGESVEFPADGYRGGYIIDIAREILHQQGTKYRNVPEEKALDFFLAYTKDKILGTIRRDLDDFRVHFDNWTSETALLAAGKVERALAVLAKCGYVYTDSGAQWFAASKLGDDKDRVLVKSDGEMTYLAPDIAYHNDKYNRGFNELIDIWGPDHHGYVPRLQAAVEALGYPRQSLRVLLVQLTTLYRNGQQVSMSTRAGEFISLRDVLNEIGVDAARYFLLMRRPEAHLDFDLAAAKKETADNPVYYIQYAHARIASVYRKYEETTSQSVSGIDWSNLPVSCLQEQAEIALIKYLVQFPIIVELCVRGLSAHLITDYLEGLVSRFHSYYEKHKIITDDAKLTCARLALIQGTKIILHNGLTLLGVAVPERM